MRYLSILILLSLFSLSTTAAPQWKDGDIIFQISQSSQCKAIQAATKSQYAHVGIMFQKDYKWYVLEAVGPVVYTPLAEWIARGERGHYVVKRLKNTDVLTLTALECMKQQGQSYLGLPYDLTFEWSDKRMYCSELVWKLYKDCAKIEVGALKKLRDFDITHPLVVAKIKERYGNNIPLDETVISPGDMFADEDLVTVFSN